MSRRRVSWALAARTLPFFGGLYLRTLSGMTWLGAITRWGA
jgi:uncharacterized membrane protein YgdD (TMEM256/DUF423 family)